MHASEEIRSALARVAELRQLASGQSTLAQSLQTIKQVQAQRFAATYADLLADPLYAPSARFFLEELYSAQDYSARDAQFSRVAGAIERTFPDAVVATVLSLAKLHRQTEELDMAMAQQWCIEKRSTPPRQYLGVWRKIGQRPMRHWQLDTVLEIGHTLGRLTRKPGLRMMLKMMRRPAELAGLGSLQHFLESGFDHFAGMARQPAAVDAFLGTIHTRETAWINKLFDAAPDQCEAELLQSLHADDEAASVA
jgi:hypothetical protein